MAGEPLVEQQLNQANQISQEIVRQSIEHQLTLQKIVDEKWKTSHEKLVEIVRQLDSDYFEACQKSGHGIDQFEDEDLYQWIALRIKALQTRLTQLDATPTILHPFKTSWMRR